MAKRFPFVVSYYCKDLAKNLQSKSTPKAAIASNNKLSFPNPNHAHVHTQGGDSLAKEGAEVMESVEEAALETVDTARDAAKKTAQLVTTAEADTNVVDTAEYRSVEDLRGQLGDGCDNIIEH